MLTSEIRTQRTFFEGIIDGPLRFEGIKDTYKEGEGPIFRADETKIGGIPDIGEVIDSLAFIKIDGVNGVHVIHFFITEIFIEELWVSILRDTNNRLIDK